MGTREVVTRPSVARAIFAPQRLEIPVPRIKPKEVVGRILGMLRPRTYLQVVRSFYADRIGLVGALACAVVLVYAGGAAMLWFHSMYLGEGGPGISPWVHWALDSTAGLFGLTPLILLIIPVAAAASSAVDHPRVTVPVFATITGTLLAVVTAPGPLLHDALIGRGTWMAARVTEWFGNEHLHATGEPQDLSIPLRMLQQIAAGIPIYVALSLMALSVIRGIHRVFAE